MGRWAQRRHRGGGPPAASALNFITEAAVDADPQFASTSPTHEPVDALNFVATEFVSNPSGTVADDVQQDGANGVLVDFLISIATDTSITYNGGASGILTPQTIAYS